MGRILVVDDDTNIRSAFDALLSTRGHEVLAAGTGEAALEMLARERPDLVVLDVVLPGMDGLETFRGIRSGHPEMPVIVMTGSGTMDVAIEASKLGAFDYQQKPFEPARMLQLIDKALESARVAQAPRVRGDDAEPSAADLIVGASPGMQQIFKLIGRVATTDATVLIRGESGTGKELVAKAIHLHSARSQEPLNIVNCAAIPETLLESELFGYERGAFTGATGRRIGMFERADHGTILLDEIGDVPLGVQAKVLRVLQAKTFERIGGGETLRVDVRILAATNRALERAITEGTFRDDLYHRLHVVTIHVPPLRERREDIPRLVGTFLARFAVDLKIAKPTLSREAMSLLCNYPWPGNVRELQHCLQRALIFSRGAPLEREDLLRALESGGVSAPGSRIAEDGPLVDFIRDLLRTRSGTSEPTLLEVVEKELLTEVLRQSRGNQTRAAELLGIPRPTLHAKLRRHGIRTTTVVENGEGRAGEQPPGT
jgi:DNA-binding NtrC family response regulator